MGDELERRLRGGVVYARPPPTQQRRSARAASHPVAELHVEHSQGQDGQDQCVSQDTLGRDPAETSRPRGPVRTLIDAFPPSARETQMQVTQDNIEWARKESRVFLRQSLEIKLVGL